MTHEQQRREIGDIVTYPDPENPYGRSVAVIIEEIDDGECYELEDGGHRTVRFADDLLSAPYCVFCAVENSGSWFETDDAMIAHIVEMHHRWTPSLRVVVR